MIHSGDSLLPKIFSLIQKYTIYMFSYWGLCNSSFLSTNDTVEYLYPLAWEAHIMLGSNGYTPDSVICRDRVV
jgi:hypothetical protein